MSISAPFIRRPVATLMLAAAVLLLGLAAWPRLPVAPLPQVDFPTLQVTANLPGASPETIAATVATPLEQQFAAIPGLVQMTSTSVLGATTIALQFSLDRDLDGVATDVQAAINNAAGQLPASLPSPPTYRKVNPADTPFLVLAVTSDAYPLAQVADVATTLLVNQISQIDGVGLVNTATGDVPAIRVQVDPQRIAALGLDLETIRAAMAEVTTDAPKGTIEGGAQSFTVFANDQLFTAAEWNDVIIAWRNGAPIRVRDIGEAVDATQSAYFAAYAVIDKGKPPVPAVTIAITKSPGANVVATADAIKARLPRLVSAMPAAMDVHLVTDRTGTIRASISDVQFTLVLSLVLVVLVVLAFLRSMRATAVPGLVLPLAILGTAAAMLPLGYSLDNLSLMALTISVGFVVDDVIVVIENIHRHVEDGAAPLEAALSGAAEIGFTVVSISVSLVAVFIPLFLIGGVVGLLLREFAAVVAIAILVSMALSLSLTPMLCARLLRPVAAAPPGRLSRAIGAGLDGLTAGYAHVLDLALRFHPVTFLVFLATVALTAWLFVTIPKGFFPEQDNGFIIAVLEAGQDASFEAVRADLLAAAEVIRKDPDVATMTLSTPGQTPNTATVIINLVPKTAGRTTPIDAVIARLGRATAVVPGVRLYMQAAQDIVIGGRRTRTQYQYTLSSPDLDALDGFAPRLLERMRALPQLVDVATDELSSAPAAVVTIDRERAAHWGIQPALIDATIYDAIGQRLVTQYFTQTASYYVVIEATPEAQADPAIFDKLYVTSPATGGQVPLSSLVTVDTDGTSLLAVNHENLFPSVTLSFNLPAGVALGEAAAAIEAASRDLAMPASISGSFQGTAAAFEESLGSLPLLIAAALVAVYIILGVLYESAIHPLTILSTLPSAGLGALAALLLGGFDLSLIGVIGLLLLIGIVKKNGIMLVDFALERQRAGGLAPREAIRAACLLRFRPILMTTLTAILAGLPLMLGHGPGAEIRWPLGVAMVGGLAVSQVLTLVTTPVIFLYLADVEARLARRRQKPRPA